MKFLLSEVLTTMVMTYPAQAMLYGAALTEFIASGGRFLQTVKGQMSLVMVGSPTDF
tara:strand:+ start:18668 stop:18838 length:171 start_codon:yes stop_codon:yes gene_type:complete